ncbi:MAG: TonB-dependent receptor [Rhodospirillaceae bacterium]|nr:TonB-dependent receptor [Rhodospirillaceae bacterium]
MRTFRPTLFASVAAIAAMIGFADIAAAQIEEIIVTSRKRAESLQDVPLSVAAFTSDSIRNLDIRSVYELQNFTPNFSFDKNFGRRFDRPIMRAQSSVQSTDIIAAFFVDGVFVSGSITGTSTDALERIEILRGPQSALYGRATFGGAINYITKQPSDEFEGQINTRAGSHDDYKGAVWMRGPIVEGKLQYFLSGNWEYYGGQYRNRNPGTPAVSVGPANNFVSVPTRADNSRIGNEETRDVTAKLRLAATEDIEFNLKMSHARTYDGPFATTWFGGNELNCFRPGIDAGTAPNSRGYYCGEFKVKGRSSAFNLPDFVDGVVMNQVNATTGALVLVNGQPVPIAAAPAKPGNRRSIYRYVADGQVDLEGWNVLVQGAYNTDKAEFVTDADRTLLRGPVTTAVTPTAPSRVFETGAAHSQSFETSYDYSGELRITSPQENRLRGLAGAYYFNQKFKTRSRSFTGTVIALARFNEDGSDFSRNFTKNKSAFAQIQYDVTDALTLSAEGRYGVEDKEIPANPATTRPVTGRFKSFVPRLTADFKLNDDVLLYASFAEGNLPGGFNLNTFSITGVNDASFAALRAANQTTFDEEKSLVYEVGTKATFLDKRASIDFDVYYIDWTKQKINNTFTVTNAIGQQLTLALQLNSGTSRVQGMEFSSSLQASENLSFTFSYGLADHVFKKANDDTEILLTTGVTDPNLVNGGNAKGKHSILAPKHSLAASAAWRDELATDTDWVLRSDFSYQTKKYGEIANYSWLGDRLIWNARLGVETSGWNVSLYANNILNDLTPSAVLRFADSAVPRWPNNQIRRGFDVPLPRGREFGISGQYNF